MTSTEVLSYARAAVLDSATGNTALRDFGTCVWCGRAMRQRKGLDTREYGLLLHIMLLGECDCGWWYSLDDNDGDNGGWSRLITGCLERYDLSSELIPLDVLNNEVRRHSHLLTAVNPKRMEDLVGRALRGTFDCEVHHMGYSRDGGVDLLMLRGNENFAVQVKRRSKNDAVEGVSGIRELLGASMLAGHSNALFVTTATRFSNEAHVAARRAVDSGLVRRFELIARDKLLAMLGRKTEASLWLAGLTNLGTRFPSRDQELCQSGYGADRTTYEDLTGGHDAGAV